MVQPLLFQRMGQRPHHVLLADERVEAPGPVLAGEDLVRHGWRAVDG